MILVDIYVPSLDKTYNFSLREDVKIGAIIEEITEMIEKKERTFFVGDRNHLNLYNKRGENMLSKNNSLADYYIVSGTQLIFV